ncbi:MAG: hypothetical protein WBD70_07655 [Mycobacterium sp.]
MDITHNLKKITTGALVSGAVAVASLGLATGTAQADPQSPGPFQWCPGQPLPGSHAASVPGVNVKIPATHVIWDNSVCHTYWQTPYGRGNVPMSDGPVSEIWDGPDPPPYFQPVCAPFVPPINCRPQNG